jgi:hypothetical protein
MKLDSGSPNYPYIIFPRFTLFQSFPFFKCQSHYIPEKIAIISSSEDILFLMTPESIDQMMQIPRVDSASPFNLEILTELYQKMTFPQRAQIFHLFLPPSTQIPSTNPPYPSSMFLTKGNQIISSLSALLGYYSDQWVDEPILGFLSIFSTDENPTTQFDFNMLLANNIHEQFVNFTTKGMFWYLSILAYLFFFFQVEKFIFFM